MAISILTLTGLCALCVSLPAHQRQLQLVHALQNHQKAIRLLGAFVLVIEVIIAACINVVSLNIVAVFMLAGFFTILIALLIAYKK